MGTQTPKAAGNSASPFPPDHGYPIRSTDLTGVEVNGDVPISAWHRSLLYAEENNEMQHGEPGPRSHVPHDPSAKDEYSPLKSSVRPNFPEYLAELLITMITKEEGAQRAKELSDAFLEAPDMPHITEQSLAELDIQNINTNIKLRHNINFDRYLSFRPNLDRIKRSGKKNPADGYWAALVAELRLYDWLFQGRPLPQGMPKNWKKNICHVKRRLPKMFLTIRDILKSLVPDRDHSRVDENLDVSMLSQEIERGVCDLVRLGEWIALLIKEHCAPMRDAMVDAMVDSIREGVTKASSDRFELIVCGLRELLGILEIMKLDVANHQIQSLKAIFIEDTVSFEKHYHLDKLVNCRSRVHINAAESWFAAATNEFGLQCTSRHRGSSNLKLEVFTRVVVATLFSNGDRSDFPETFYLDQERIRTLKAEICNLVCLEICTDMFTVLTKQLGSTGCVASATRQFQVSVAAIVNEAAGQGLQHWLANSEALSLEILRQASQVAGRSSTYYFDFLSETHQQLQISLKSRFIHHSARLGNLILPQILRNVECHAESTPMDLFINLTSTSPPVPRSLQNLAHPILSDTLPHHSLYPETGKLTNLSNRVSHIILLHWRIWRSIAYIQDEDILQSSADDAENVETTSSAYSQSKHSSLSGLNLTAEDHQVMTGMKTAEPPDSSQETQIAHQTRTQ